MYNIQLYHNVIIHESVGMHPGFSLTRRAHVVSFVEDFLIYFPFQTSSPRTRTLTSNADASKPNRLLCRNVTLFPSPGIALKNGASPSSPSTERADQHQRP
jgi:hypothetical protein